MDPEEVLDDKGGTVALNMDHLAEATRGEEEDHQVDSGPKWKRSQFGVFRSRRA